MNWLPPPQDFRGRLAAADGRRGGTPWGARRARQRPALVPRDAAARRGARPRPRRPRAPGRSSRCGWRCSPAAPSTTCCPGSASAGLRRGLRIAAHAGGYGQYRQELLDPGGLAAFRPDAVLLALASRDFLGAVPLAASAAAADAARRGRRGRPQGALGPRPRARWARPSSSSRRSSISSRRCSAGSTRRCPGRRRGSSSA